MGPRAQSHGHHRGLRKDQSMVSIFKISKQSVVSNATDICGLSFLKYQFQNTAIHGINKRQFFSNNLAKIAPFSRIEAEKEQATDPGESPDGEGWQSRNYDIHNLQKVSNMNQAIIDDYINAPHAFPGGYPKIMIMQDGGFVCPKCVKDNRTLIIEATKSNGPFDKQWAMATVDLHMEGPAITCDHCCEATESAYGEADESTPDGEG